MALPWASIKTWLVRTLLHWTLISAVVGLSPAKGHPTGVIAPKVFIIGMFIDEGTVWFNIPQFNLLAQNITIPGFSPLFPQAHCTQDGSICSLTTGEGEINAALTIAALTNSPAFNLTQTYFFIAGIAGVSPKVATLGSATFARFAVQVGLQMEFDAREKPPSFSTGYFPQGSTSPDEYPQAIYGTEVFELNDNLRQLAIKMAKTATLADDATAQAYRKLYAPDPAFRAGASPPTIVACDTATSDVFWSGALLGSAFENTTRLFTNGTATYCVSQQEDNATLGALLRAAAIRKVDFARIIVMRTGSDFDRPHPGQTAPANVQAGFPGAGPSLANILRAGVPVVTGIVAGWAETFERGVRPTNYVGDIFGTLGGEPDFGPGSILGNVKAP